MFFPKIVANIMLMMYKTTAQKGGCYLELSLSLIYLKKSCGAEFVALNILEIVSVDGQRGCPNTDARLLLLNVVGSRPLRFANPEQDMPWSCANNSIACQI